MRTSPANGTADVQGYGALWAMVQEHLDRTSVSERAFARQAGLKHQTLNAWKNREAHQLPQRETLEQVARALGVPYLDVLRAALRDAGYVDDPDQMSTGDPTAMLSADRRRAVLTLVQMLAPPG